MSQQFLPCRWGILFSHPRDFTPVCTTELACAARLTDEFKKRGVKMIALSIDSVEDHKNWSKVWVYIYIIVFLSLPDIFTLSLNLYLKGTYAKFTF